jgi:putative ABC transport system substrate-binding protein
MIWTAPFSTLQHIRRRDVLAGLTTLASGIVPARYASAQTRPRMLRIGTVQSVLRERPTFRAFEHRLRELGYVEGHDLVIDYSIVRGETELYGPAMQELVRRKVDIIVAGGNEFALKSAMAATDTLPIVMVAIDYDPVALGYVSSLARPAGNVTGVFLPQIDLTLKRLQLLREAFPDHTAVTVLWDRRSAHQWQAAQEAAPSLGLQLTGVELRALPYDYEQALARPLDHRGALMTMMTPFFFTDRQRLAELALRHRIAAFFPQREFVEAGGLLGYGPSITGLWRRAADYVDRIARGAKTTDLPIEQPSKFEMVVNLKTARAIGVELPTSILLRADEVIE